MRRLPWIALALVIGLLVASRVARQLTRVRPHAASSAKSGNSAVARRGAAVMGTVLEISVEADAGALAERLADGALAIARHWDDVLTTWRPDGELARLNAVAGQGEVEISADLASALARMRELCAATAGAFDPAVGPLVVWWRLDSATRAVRPRPPGPWSLAEVLAGDGRRVRLRAGAALDAGGIGKGIALDAMARAARGGGATAAFFDFGGSSQLAFGSFAAPPHAPELALAGLAPGTLHGSLPLRDAAVSSSRSAPVGTQAGSIVDPRSGDAVPPGRLVTVVADDATTAEAWSTALVVLGRGGVDTARRAGVEVLFEDGDGAALTPGFPIVGRAAGNGSQGASQIFDVPRLEG